MPELRPSGLSELSECVRVELSAAGRLNTFYGQLAVELAGRLEDPDETGISSLSRELRLVMEAALQRCETSGGSRGAG